MGILTDLKDSVSAINTPAPRVEPVEPKPDTQHIDLEAITQAIGELSEALKDSNSEQLGQIDETTTAHVIEIQAGLKALVRTIEAATKAQDRRTDKHSNTHTKALHDAVANIVDAIAKIETSVVVNQQHGPVRFDIERDSRGYMQSVTATPSD